MSDINMLAAIKEASDALSEYIPNWKSQIDIELLDMTTKSQYCIIGQLLTSELLCYDVAVHLWENYPAFCNSFLGYNVKDYQILWMKELNHSSET